MRRIFLLFILFAPVGFLIGQYNENTTPTYPALINAYKEFAEKHEEIQLFQMGESDYGLPIYLCVINGGRDSLETFERAKNATTILINNGIHAGEPDGINACLLWIERWIRNGKKTKNLPVLAIIPAYNVGGMMNRSASSRANQLGPEEYGFRGNAQNLDLNRDFVKMDSKNMFTFAKIYHALNPDIFIDTHVSNGADYPYVLTYITSIKERLAPSMKVLIHEKMFPELTSALDKEALKLFPYVDLARDTPVEGMLTFNDLPRYSSGYVSLFHTIGITLETHMLKPFPVRVQATLAFLEATISWSFENSKQIEKARKEAFDFDTKTEKFTYNYRLNEICDSICFEGFESTYPISEVTGFERLKYDKNKSYEVNIPYYTTFLHQDSLLIPDFFVLGGQCADVIKRLSANNVELIHLQKDSVMYLTNFRITDYDTYNFPYENHYPHYNVSVNQFQSLVKLKRGDVIIPVYQKHKRFILSVLTPNTEDSYFNWNFFDSYLGQKEHYSAYVFEDYALHLLKENDHLRKEFEIKKANDELFRNSAKMQLDFIYENSPYFEHTFRLLPLYSGQLVH